MKYIKTTTWGKVFENWAAHEGKDPAWIKHAKERGWEGWASWRKDMAEEQLKVAELIWKIYEFTDPMNEIPALLLGPFESWQSRVAGIENASFQNLVAIPQEYEFFSNHGKVQAIRSNFPSTALLIGLVRKDIGKIVCIEGTHRATAVALDQKEGKETHFSQPVKIALADLPKKKVHLLEKALESGTAKKPEKK